jgi:2-dehydropantoate 2-reductase
VIVGAGAIGAWLAAALDRAAWSVGLLARGATLAALRRDGLTVESAQGTHHCRPQAGGVDELVQPDFLVVTVKAQTLPALAPTLAPLVGPDTVVVSATNGIPWWFLQGLAGPLADQTLASVDPQGTQAAVFPRERSLGGVVHAAVRTLAPAHARVVAADRLLLGHPDGRASAALERLVQALRQGGINAVAVADIRLEVWAKLWGNMNMNPLSALMRSGTAAMLSDPEVCEICVHMMDEMQACGVPLQLRLDMTALERMAVTRRLGDFKTSMLADLEAGRPLELEPQLGAVVEIAQRLGVAAPFSRAILALTRRISP